ncbi:Diphthamide biosynthesis protein 3 [Brettanomyces nanus]|uniref:Diphthamide biosynthesis protein 3 n=1 Tax=Eeniella nana TaxID=13502 RepID=A0A875S8B9_EENNA|nr:Diphthamide biosynthesis protein 3 [Brettanomyces nanus]QPG76152.1 Diphthamide biosynthesis protein 3 [Brettanomyces nanus]
MSEQISVYDQIEIEDFTFDPDLQVFSYPCPCGDRFQISLGDMEDGENIAVCPSCSLMVEVIFEKEDLGEYIDEVA